MTTLVIFLGIFLVGAILVACFSGKQPTYGRETRAANKNGTSFFQDKNAYHRG